MASHQSYNERMLNETMLFEDLLYNKSLKAQALEPNELSLIPSSATLYRWNFAFRTLYSSSKMGIMLPTSQVHYKN